MKTKTPFSAGTLTVLLLSLLALSGCIGLGQTMQFEQSAVTVVETPSVRLETFNGDIEVTTGAAGKVSAGITKRGADDAQLQDIEFNFSQNNREVEGRCMWKSAGERPGARCDLTVQVPAGTDVEVMTGNGNVTYRAAPGKTLNISAGNGNLNVTLPPDAQFTLRAAVGNGEVKNVFDLTQTETDEPRHVIGTIGASPTLDVMLSVGNGDITIEREK